MTTKLSDEQLQELNRKKEWCLAILNFMLARYGDKVMEEAIEVVAQTYLSRDLTGMRTITRDTNEWARGLSASNRSELNALLKEKFGEDLLENRSKDLVKIDRIRKRGRIRGENEFRLVKERKEEIWDDEDKKEENEALNKLLADFERS